MRMLLKTATIFALIWGMATMALADSEARNGVVVELFTSQGCSSCPPADELLTTLAARDDVIALALHVDYWDYIGWKDAHAQPKFTARQRGYARVAGSRMIYTPQMVIGGHKHVIGARPLDVAMAIEEQLDVPPAVDMVLSRDGEQLRIAAEIPQSRTGDISVQVVRYLPEETVDILRGENRGRTITYSNIVTSWEQVAQWSGEVTLDLTVPLTGDDAIAVILQQAGPGPIVAAQILP